MRYSFNSKHRNKLSAVSIKGGFFRLGRCYHHTERPYVTGFSGYFLMLGALWV